MNTPAVAIRRVRADDLPKIVRFAFTVSITADRDWAAG